MVQESLVDANMASAHIPFFLDGKLSTDCRSVNSPPPLTLSHTFVYDTEVFGA